MAVKIAKGKFPGITTCANDKGVIAAAAMDQRGSLEKAISKARGAPATPEDLVRFKKAVTSVLTQHASAILLDPEFGLPAVKARAKGTGVLLAYEKTGYDTKDDSRLPDLLPEWSVRRLVEAGASAIKILLYYNPTHPERINGIKKAFIERIGGECAANDVPFFLEIIAYDDAVGDAKSLEFAKVKPHHVKAYMEEFSKPRYGVDILKVEVPVNLAFVEGTKAFGGQKAYSAQGGDAAFQGFRRERRQAPSSTSAPGSPTTCSARRWSLPRKPARRSPACSAAGPRGRTASPCTPPRGTMP